MKSKTLKIWLCLGLLFLGLFSCDEELSSIDTSCVEVRVVEWLCLDAIIEVVSPEHSSMGLDGWTDREGRTHDNVFFTSIHCDDVDLIPQDGSTFHIEIIDNQIYQGCYVCNAGITEGPAYFLNFRVADCQ